MTITVYIPTPFRSLTGNRCYVGAEGCTVEELLDDLGARPPALRNLLGGDGDEIPAHINIYVNSHEIHTLQGKATPLKDGDEVAVIPAIAGGQGAPPDQVLRYSRHIIMPQVGPIGQRKLLAAKVLVLGAGGLGSPVSLYLALAGVGTLGIVDFDDVDLSNLQRQMLHHTHDVGRPKVESARDTIAAHNPAGKIAPSREPLTSANAIEIMSGYDIVVNGADNFGTR